MLLAENMYFCTDTANIWQILGYVVMIIKIVIPLILIVLGMIDLGKAVISSDEKAINKAVTTLLKRFIAAVVIFFIPVIISALFNALDIMNDPGTKADYNVCVQCVTNVGGDTCDEAVACSLAAENPSADCENLKDNSTTNNSSTGNNSTNVIN